MKGHCTIADYTGCGIQYIHSSLTFPWSSPFLICEEMSAMCCGAWGMNTALLLLWPPMSFIVSKYLQPTANAHDSKRKDAGSEASGPDSLIENWE